MVHTTPLPAYKRLFRLLILLCIAAFGTAFYTQPAHAASCMTNQYDKFFKKYSQQYFGPIYDWRWFKAVAITESGLCREAVSSQGARGLMQIMPATYQEIRLDLPGLSSNSFHAESNIHAGVFYLRKLYRHWGNAMPQEATAFMLASYNGGIGRVSRAQQRTGGKLFWSAIEKNMPSETRKYVDRVHKIYIRRTRVDSR